jgi:5-formyltetrahydrofolate cyclo-ligase
MKKAIRKEILKIRDNIPLKIKSEKDELLKEQLFLMSEFLSAKTILFYASFRSEVDTYSMIKESLKMGRKVVLPRVDKQKHALVLYELKDMKELTPGYMGIPEPSVSDERIVDINEIDLVIIPGAAFDYSGNRLGYGAGYYDILLSHRKKRTPVIALAYEEQLVDSIPAEEHDVRVDMIVTDQRIVSVQ